jgi:DNA-binding ferritin-like protein
MQDEVEKIINQITERITAKKNSIISSMSKISELNKIAKPTKATKIKKSL